MSAHDVTLFGDQDAAARLAAKFGGADAPELMRLAIEDLFPGRIVLVSSFGADFVVLLHMASEIDKALPIAFVETLPITFLKRLPIATRLSAASVSRASRRRRRTKRRWPKPTPRISSGRPTPTAAANCARSRLFAKALEGYDAWITGRKRFQAATRAALPLFETEGDRVKINPLAGWTQDRIEAYFKEHDLPPHPLVAKGFLSIGCIPCTSPVQPGEEARAGRWRGRAKTECGIHVQTLDAGSDI